MENADAVTKGLLWFLALVCSAVLAAGTYATIQLGEWQWIIISFVVMIVGAVIAAALLGSVAVLNLAVFAPILWLANRISGRHKRADNNGT